MQPLMGTDVHEQESHNAVGSSSSHRMRKRLCSSVLQATRSTLQQDTKQVHEDVSNVHYVLKVAFFPNNCGLMACTLCVGCMRGGWASVGCAGRRRARLAAW